MVLQSSTTPAAGVESSIVFAGAAGTTMARIRPQHEDATYNIRELFLMLEVLEPFRKPCESLQQVPSESERQRLPSILDINGAQTIARSLAPLLPARPPALGGPTCMPIAQVIL